MFIITIIKRFFEKHKIGICISILLPLYHLLIVNQAKLFGVSEITYAFFTVDYSMGFCDKIFVGELFHLISGKYTHEAATAFVSFFYIVFVLVISYLSEKFICRFQQSPRACFVLTGFFLTGPFSFSIFIKQFGMLDFFWAFFFFAAIVFLNNKYLKFFVPVLAVLMIFVHYGAMICYVAALLLVIVFYVLKSETKNERVTYIVILSLTVILSFGFAYYFIKNNSDNLVYSIEQFRHIVQDVRGGHSSYYDTAFYKELPLEVNSSELYQKAYDLGVVGDGVMYVNNIFELLKIQVITTINAVSIEQIISCFLISLFPWMFFIYIMRLYFKEHASIMKKLVALVFSALCFVIQLIGCFLSTDTPRWFANSFILLFTFISVIIYFDYGDGIKRVEKLISKNGIGFEYIFLFFFSNIVLDPYTFSFF